MKDNTRFILCALSIICVFASYMMLQNYMLSNNNIEQSKHRLDSIGQDTIVSTQVLTFEYNGDKYIEFIRDDRSYVIHDPKCPCLSSKLNNITTVITKNTTSHTNELDNNNRKNFRVIIDKITELDKKINSIPRGYVPKPIVKKAATKQVPKKQATKKKK